MSDQQLTLTDPEIGAGDSLEGLLEFNFSRTVPTDATKRRHAADNVAVVQQAALGLYRANLPLKPIDLVTLSFICQAWSDQGRKTSAEPVEFSLSELARVAYDPRAANGETTEIGGKNRRLVRESLERLYRVEISANLQMRDHDGMSVRMQDHVRVLQRATVWSDLKSRGDGDLDDRTFARLAGARRLKRDTVVVWLSEWLVQQLRSGFGIAVDLDKLRRLSGLPQRLYAWLGLPPSSAHISELPAVRVRVTRALLTTWGINRADPRESARAIRDAGKRIVDVDERLEIVTTERDSSGDYFLVVTPSEHFRSSAPLEVAV